MKKIILNIFLLIISFVANGQNFGFKVGINDSYLWGDDFKDPRPGIQFGMIFRYNISETFSSQYEFTYSVEGFKDHDFTVRLNYLNIPILFKYHTSKFSFFGGPQVSILLNGSTDPAIISDEDIKTLFQKGKLGLVLGISYEIIKDLEIDFRYANSIHNVYDRQVAGDIWYTSGLINFSFSYWIPGKQF